MASGTPGAGEEGGGGDTEEEKLFRLYKEQAHGVGPILAKTLQDSLKLRGKYLEKLEAELKEQLASLQTDEKVLLHVLEKQFGEAG